MLRAQIGAAYGQGVTYHWCIGANGRMYLDSIDWICGQNADREFLSDCTLTLSEHLPLPET